LWSHPQFVELYDERLIAHSPKFSVCEFDNLTLPHYLTRMQLVSGATWIRFVAAIAFLCFVGQRLAMEFEHLGLIHLDSHFAGHTDESNVPDGEQSEDMGYHHHLADMIFFGLENTTSPTASISSLLVLDELYHEGPVFGIDHPPQLSWSFAGAFVPASRH
jgi:hypothetical protein